MNQFTAVTDYFDFNQPIVKQFAAEITKGISDPIEKAIALYYRVRDDFRYDPYTFRADPETFKASYLLEKGSSYCIPKAVLLGAAARCVGIPSRLGFADVVNHLSEPKFLEKMKTNIFAMHGYIELYLDQHWVKATPAFNRSLCELYGVQPLDFDGRQDSIFHEFTGDGSKYMEYVKDYGSFADLPYELIVRTIKSTYPHLAEAIDQGDWISR